MKTITTILLILTSAICVFGQVKKNVAPKDYVQVVITEEEATSELLPMPVGMSPNLSAARIGIRYFGVNSESDLSFILLLKGTKNRYSTNESFGIKLYAGDIPLSNNKYKPVVDVEKDGDEHILRFYLNTESLAWLATANSVKVEIYNLDTERKYDTLSLTPAEFAEFKRFAKSVLLIRSQFN